MEVVASIVLGRPRLLLCSPAKDVAAVYVELSPLETFEPDAQSGSRTAFASWPEISLTKLLPQVSRPEECVPAVGKACENPTSKQSPVEFNFSRYTLAISGISLEGTKLNETRMKAVISKSPHKKRTQQYLRLHISRVRNVDGAQSRKRGNNRACH